MGGCARRVSVVDWRREIRNRGRRQMSLQLNIDELARPGRRAVPLEVEVSRELTETDIALLQTPGSTQAPELQRITDRHHHLARLLAAGKGESEAALMTGYSASRISVLKNSPAFMELVALYQREAKLEFLSAIEQMAGLSMDAMLELRRRVEESPDSLTTNELLNIAKEMHDRGAAGDEQSHTMPVRIELVAPKAAE